ERHQQPDRDSAARFGTPLGSRSGGYGVERSRLEDSSGILRRIVVLALYLELLNLPGERVAPETEQVRGFDTASPSVGERFLNQRALELTRHLVHDVLLAAVERGFRFALEGTDPCLCRVDALRFAELRGQVGDVDAHSWRHDGKPMA